MATTGRLRRVAEEAFEAAVAAVEPEAAVRDVLRHRPLPDRVRVVGFGKAAVAMTTSAASVVGARRLVAPSLAITTHAGAARAVPDADPEVEVLGAGHPLPDHAGVAAARRLVEIVTAEEACDLLIVLVSGGGSALLTSPAPGIELDDLILTTDLLLKSGVDIDSLNVVRKRLSTLKGGRLARLAGPTPVLALILSDVVGDDPSAIAAGPTAPDASTFVEAREVLARSGCWDRIPHAVRSHMELGVAGIEPDTPGPEDPLFESVENIVVAGNRTAVAAAAASVRRAGHVVGAISEPIVGPARDAGRGLVERAWKAHGRLTALVGGGETTVEVVGRGRGGRNQEMALGFALAARRLPAERWAFLSGGTDGIDGPTQAAGAVVDAGTLERIRRSGIDPEAALDENDSGTALAASGDLVVVGPTGTNVGDIQIVVW